VRNARRRTAILISGRGSNMGALIAAARAPDYPAEIALVLSNRPDAAGLGIARDLGIAVAAVDHKIYAGREEFERSMQAMLEIHRIELVCMAGFMRLVTPWFVTQWQGRMINIHPALLPAYRGLHTHERALADGVKIHGCTVHFVVPATDEGPIIAQAAVPVLDADTPESLARRVLAQEHKLYPAALARVAEGSLTVQGNRVSNAGATSEPAPLVVPPYAVGAALRRGPEAIDQPVISLPENHCAISICAVSGASDPCAEFSPTEIACSLRIVPGSALAGSVAPSTSR
jgi:phosphoribosylglycinamide formyltransferase 1